MNKIYFVKKLCITWCLFFSCFYVFSMSKNSSSNKHYKSYFLLSDTFKISTQANIGGVYDDTLFVKKDTNFTVHFQADSGYYIDSIIINDTLFANDSINGYTFYNIQGNQKIRIVFYPFCANVSEQIKFYDSASHTDSIFINAPNCRWRASTTSNWLHLFQNKDIGSKYVRFAISANTDTLNRTGFIIVGNKQIAIQQFVGKKYFFVETQSNEGGNIYPQKTNIVVGDSNFIVRFTPLNNFIVDSVWVNGLYKPDSNKQYTISNIQNNYQIKVQFKYVPSTRFVTIQNGQISPVGLQIKKDTSIRFSYYPNEGYTFDYVVANGKIYKDSTTHFTLDSINYDSRIGVFFKPIGNTITVNKKYKGIRNKIDSIVSNVYPEWEPFWKKRIGGTPILNTLLPYNSTTTSIIIGNTVEDFASGIDEKGFCINTMPNLLSCEINKKITTDLLNKTTEFTLTNLLSNTTYYYRPFAKNKYGIGYGEEVSFTTLPNPNNPASNQYTLTTFITNGTITPTQNLNIGTQVKITYAANSGYKITAVYVNNIKQTGTGLISVNATNGYIWVTANTHKTISVITNNIYPPVSAGLSLANLDSNMVLIPAGSFTMGATNEQLANNGDSYSAFWKPTKQQVTLSNYKICRFEVTQQLWQDVMGSNPSYFNGGSNGTNLQRPVEQVSWDDCQIFIDSLNKKTGKKYRLPTEAEWEYAARGGANSTNSYIYIGGDTLDSVAWNPNNSSDQTHTVGTKKANALGLYDMSGNVWEWCYDWYGNYSNTNVSNPEGPGSGNYRVTRGGGWFGFPFSYRVSYRFFTDPIDIYFASSYDLGLRLVLDSILPPNTTNAVTSITSITNTTATANINISNPNGLSITAAGVVYSSSNSTPTKADAYIAESSTGNLLGNYTLWLSSLTANTTYYVRGYLNFKGTIYYGSVQTFTTTNLTLTFANLDSNMVLVPAGSFTMGATNEQLANNGDGYSVFWSPATQQVTLSSYKICRFEVTQQLWQDVMGSNPSNFTGNLQRPVWQVSWDSCQIFIDSLNKKTGKNYRLPTEAEWEYAARGGVNSTYSYIYSGGNTLNDVAWNSNNSNSQTQTVGNKQANALGLYDMSGNVWEWCSDWYGNYSNSAVTNPQGPSSGTYRVYRGGSWYYDGKYYRVSYRDGNYPNMPYNGGLRLAITNQYTLTTTISHGSITPTQKMNEGSQLKITYTADSGYKISAVYVNNIKQIGDSVIDFTNSKGYILVTADSNKTITVITAIRYPVVSAGLNLANLDSNMVPIPAGSFTIGCTNEQGVCNANEMPTHQVTLSNYKICRFEVTQQLWQDVMGSNPSYFNGVTFGTNLQRPVEQVSWNDCQKFIDSLNKKTGKNYRLPTEAEWEYAARGGANSTYSYIYSGGNTLNDVAWNINNSSSQTQTVGTKQANALGLYDMTGNVWEWCNDWYGNYSNSAVTNPQGAVSASYRVFRGGSWNSNGDNNRVSYRNGDIPSSSGYNIGLRLVITNQYTLTTTISHGSITPTQKMNEGSQLKITYTADSGYKISAVYVNNIKQIGDSVIDFTNSKGYILVTADSNKTITVITAIRYPVVSAGLNLANLDSNMVPIPAGSFTIGCTNEQGVCNTNEMPTHQVTLSNYKICRFEVTQQLWQDVMGSNPSYFNGGSNGTNLQRPVERVSWNDCQIFIDSLNKKTGKTYRLPTEAEWEYAARGGANSTYSYIYSGGNTLNDVAWNLNNSNYKTHTVGTKLVNALGLYDMTGNVWEWCNDWYGNYSNSADTNPQGPVSAAIRVFRGGSWNGLGSNSRVSYRDYHYPSYSSYYYGLRLAITNQYTLTTTISHGSITPTQKIYEGSQLKITYTADSGYKISAVYVNNIKQIGDSVIDFTNSKGYILVTADSNKTITVITAIRYPVVSAGLNLANLESNMVPVPAGSFTIGCTNEQSNCDANESPTHQVTLSNYKICRFEVTQQLWQDVMGSNPSYFNGGSFGTNLQRPVERVSWGYCQIFIDSLNKKTGKNYRLPTEAEWEYAARGGVNSTYSYIYSGGNTLNDVAWNSNNSNSQTQTVGTKQANALGLYDMTGNVWEWCSDLYGPARGSDRVIRGGSWSISGDYGRVSYRNFSYPSFSYNSGGFRLVFSSN